MWGSALMCMMTALGDGPAASGSLTAESAQVTLVEEVEVPAKEPGALARLVVREGDLVTAGQELGNLESDQAEVAKASKLIELQMAEEKSTNDVEVRLAKKSRDVAKSELQRARDSVLRRLPVSQRPSWIGCG